MIMKKISTVILLAGLSLGSTVQAQVTYDKVASIFYAHCTVCHNSGGVAPFSLMNYTETSSFSASIASAINKGIMPPWHADTLYVTSGHKGSRFLDENTLSPTEKKDILQWVADGALEGDQANVPTAPKYGDLSYKLNGEASLTLMIPNFPSNATETSNPYNCFSLPTNLTKDRWLRAFEIIPSSLKAVHHVVVSVDTTGTVASKLDGNCGQQPGEIGIGGWTSGCAPTVFPNDPTFKAGVRIPKGSNFILQMHYAPGSGGIVDSTKIRLFFYDEGEKGIRTMHSDVMLQNWDLVGRLLGGGAPSIPKNKKTIFKATPSTPSPSPHAPQPATAMSIFAANPHSHNVCSKIKNYAYNSAGDTIPVISITNWDYAWQGNYYFPKMLKIPAGYKLESEHLYDNTSSNSHLNQSIPRVDVNFGQATSDEMLFDAFVWFDYQPGDENIDIKSLLSKEKLLQVGIYKIDAPATLQSNIYPNPASGSVNISMAKRSAYAARISNITGQTVLQTETFVDKLTVDLKEIPAGLYVIEVVDTKTNEKITDKLIVTN
jgi:hypothetical protein